VVVVIVCIRARLFGITHILYQKPDCGVWYHCGRFCRYV
jgi:hypothetical protein